jgi:hypothetical protein
LDTGFGQPFGGRGGTEDGLCRKGDGPSHKRSATLPQDPIALPGSTERIQRLATRAIASVEELGADITSLIAMRGGSPTAGAMFGPIPVAGDVLEIVVYLRRRS